MTTLEKTSARIRDLVPRLKKLSFGCEVKLLSSGELYIIVFKKNEADWAELRLMRNGAVSILYELFSDYEYCEYESDVEDFLKIIGHQINLEDVLEAIEIHQDRKISGMNLKNICKMWQYGKIYYQQGEDLWKFIEDILF